MMLLRIWCIRRAVAGFTLGGLGLSLVLGCDSDDAILVDDRGELEPSDPRASRDDEEEASPSADEDTATVDDAVDEDTESEAPLSNLGRDQRDDAEGTDP